MQKIKNYIRPIITFLIMLIIYLAIFVIFHYTGIVSLSSVSKINLIIMSIFTLIIGIKNGKKTSKKGYLEGLKIGSLIVTILFIINLIFYRSLNLNLLIYYLIIISSTTIGSMIGINLKH